MSQDENTSILKATFANAKNNFPSLQKIDKSSKLTEKGKKTFKRLIEIINSGNEISERTTLAEATLISNSFDSVMNVLGIYPKHKNGTTSTAKIRQSGFAKGIVIMDFKDGGCVSQCNNIYNTCMSENNCSRGGWVCFCCMGCSLAFATCMAACTID